MPVLKSVKKHKLLLDTHVWIWLIMGDERLSRNFRRAIDESQENSLIFISAITIWEIGMLVERKRIELEMDCIDWIEESLGKPGVNLLPLSPRIAIQSFRLPGNPHGDPADRILVATACESNAILVTHDEKLLQLGKNKWLGVYDPCR